MNAFSDTVDILGIQIARGGLESAIKKAEDLLESGHKSQIIVLNVSSIMTARKRSRFRAAIDEASLVVPDGKPLVWAARILHKPIAGRVTGSDLLMELTRISALKDYSCFFLGADERVVKKLISKVALKFPGLKVAGAFSPETFQRFPSSVRDEMIRRVNERKPDILWVGLGAPKQEIWINENLDKLDIKIAIGIGAAFDFYSGSIRRAPRWMQSIGLEWLHRVLMEPRRLFRRYFIDAAPFFPLVFRQLLRDLRHRRR